MVTGFYTLTVLSIEKSQLQPNFLEDIIPVKYS